MASSASATHSPLTLSSVLSQELNPTITSSSISFKLQPHFFIPTKSLSLFPLVLQSRERKSASLGHWVSSDGSLSKSAVVVAAVAEVAEAVEEQEGEGEGAGGGVAVAAPPAKPKKGKAALPLKRDRVCLKLFF